MCVLSRRDGEHFARRFSPSVLGTGPANLENGKRLPDPRAAYRIRRPLAYGKFNWTVLAPMERGDSGSLREETQATPKRDAHRFRRDRIAQRR